MQTNASMKLIKKRIFAGILLIWCVLVIKMFLAVTQEDNSDRSKLPQFDTISKFRFVKRRKIDTERHKLLQFDTIPKSRFVKEEVETRTDGSTAIQKTELNNKIMNWINFDSPPQKPKCKSEMQVGPLYVNTTRVSLDVLHATELSFVKSGGWWYPKDCAGYNSTAIIIPFRNRHYHLPILLRQLHPILKRQNLHYRVFVIEQDDKKPFNRGKLLNVGFVEALRLFPYSCVVFHDVDLIPEDDMIGYGCLASPVHLSAAVSSFNYTLPYYYLFGGVEMLEPYHFRKVNGFSNIFYGWGGEDDELSRRLRASGFNIYRYPEYIARYKALDHDQRERTVEEEQQTAVYNEVAEQNWREDGLNSLQYKVNSIREYKLYTSIKVDLLREKERSFSYITEILQNNTLDFV